MKKTTSFILSAAILAAMIPSAFAASEIGTVSGEVPAYGETLTFDCADGASVEWHRVSESEDTVVGTGSMYIVTEADAGYGLKAVAKSADGTTLEESNTAAIASWVSAKERNKAYSGNADVNSDYTFLMDGKSFTIGNIFNNDESKYLVIANDLYGKRAVSDNKIVKFDGEDSTNIQYWLDHDFADSIPSGIKDSINFDHIWLTEPEYTSAEPVCYTFKGGITLPSVSEFIKYPNMGTKSADTYYTRTPVFFFRGKTQLFAIEPGKAGLTEFTPSTTSVDKECAVRPIFYLKEGFFKTNAVDLERAGAAVRKEIAKYSTEELMNIYSIFDIIKYLGKNPPAGFLLLENAKVYAKSGEKIKSGETLAVSFDYSEQNTNEMADWRVEWYKKDSTETKLIGEDKEYIVTDADAGCEIYCKIFVTDTEGGSGETQSDAAAVESISNEAKGPNYTVSMSKEADSKYKFTVDGQSFTLVDTLNNSKSKFFVIANTTYGLKILSSNKMDTNDDASIQKWLDNSFAQTGNNGQALPAELVKYIDFDHIWLAEPAPNASEPLEAYSFKGGITLPSISEMEKYKDIMGWDETRSRYWTRTCANHFEAGKIFILTIGQDIGSGFLANHWDIPSQANVCPEFYLNEDFFKNVKIDLGSAGSAVLDTMKKNYTIEDLSALYSEGELRTHGFHRSYEAEVSFDTQSLEGIGSISADVTFNSYNKIEKSGVAIMILYDANGLSVGMTAAPVKTGETKTLSLDNLSDVTDGYNVKVMIWNDALNMNVITKAVGFK